MKTNRRMKRCTSQDKPATESSSARIRCRSTWRLRPKQKQKQKGGGGDEGGEKGEGGQKLAEKGEELKEEMDNLLDEIDAVLEENAEEFVKNYVQRGGRVTRSLAGHPEGAVRGDASSPTRSLVF